MIEIALALAVIAFGLVAIIGFLPFGLGVQRENKDDTVIDHDARMFLQFIRMEPDVPIDLETLHRLWTYIVPDKDGIRKVWVTNVTIVYEKECGQLKSSQVTGVYEYEAVSPFINPISDRPKVSMDALLKLKPFGGQIEVDTNADRLKVTITRLTVRLRAGAGSAFDKYPQTDSAVTEMSFKYLLVRETTPVVSKWQLGSLPQLYDVRFSFAWPVYPNGTVGYGRRVYRTQVLSEER
jgi:hypothetical protein